MIDFPGIESLNYIVYNDVSILDLVMVLIIYLVASLIAKILTINLRRALRERVSRDQLNIANKIIYLILLGFALIVTMPVLGFNLSGLLVAGGFFALAIGFAAQSVVSNLLSGVLLSIERPMKVGETVEIDGVEGTVEDIHIISTKIRTYAGVYVRISNEKVFTSKITNYSMNVARRFEYDIGIRYADDAQKAVKVVMGILEEHPMVLQYPASQAYVTELGDNAVVLKVKVWGPVKDFIWWDLRVELLAKIKLALEANGIQIPFPQREVWFRNELVNAKISD